MAMKPSIKQRHLFTLLNLKITQTKALYSKSAFHNTTFKYRRPYNEGTYFRIVQAIVKRVAYGLCPLA